MDEELHGFAQAHEGVDDLAEEIEGELVARDYVLEQQLIRGGLKKFPYHIEQEHYEVKYERYYVKHEPLLSPLFPIVQLHQTDGILEIVLYRL